ncbi:hypothetical protein [Williamsia deligens]|uniref:Uncharacterized protein n=1 Tax=Williamsia deligens TaxID=321325 RepID=A0ABW3G9I3_9NOCA|nr:hypothetical protein [Williamsia deligens]MCP2193840.1 hypothetical protein [Williamsia deligens]
MSRATTVTTAALGVVTPWSAPVRLLAARGLLRARAARKASAEQGPTPARPSRRRRRRPSARTVVTVLGIGGVVAAAGGVAIALRGGRRTPPPVAPAPPRVEDIPTSDPAGGATGPE